MAEKPKGRSKAHQKPPKVAKKGQAERFVDAAREAGVDESGAEFERALARVLGPSKKQKPGV